LETNELIKIYEKLLSFPLAITKPPEDRFVQDMIRNYASLSNVNYYKNQISKLEQMISIY
jgi:hypothetical protein